MYDLLQRHFYLIFWTLVCTIYYSATFTSFLYPSIYVVTLYEIVGGGDLPQCREWFRSLRSLNHNYPSGNITTKTVWKTTQQNYFSDEFDIH